MSKTAITSPQRLRDACGEAHEYVVTLTDRQACALRHIVHERVIRCKDCRKWSTERRYFGGCAGPCGIFYPDGVGFCSQAEPKEES